MNKQIKLDFYNELTDFELLPSMRAYMKRAFLEAVNRMNVPCPVQASVSFVDEQSIREYNNENRKIDRVTDVLSFPLQEYNEGSLNYDNVSDGEYDEDGFLMLGDVVICVSVAEKQAEEFGHSTERELVYLFVHSVLHLFGFDHEEDEQKVRMRAEEEKIMTKIGLSRDE